MSTGVTDPVITPFVLGMQAAGWMVATAQNSRAAALGRCHRCQNPYVFTFLLDAAKVSLCPLCDGGDA